MVRSDVVLTPGPMGIVDKSQALIVAEALARATAAGVGHCDALVLTSGETAAAVLKALGAGSFTVLGEIEPGVVMSLLHNVSQSFEGPLTEAAMERMSFDRVFVGAGAVTAGGRHLRGRPARFLDETDGWSELGELAVK